MMHEGSLSTAADQDTRRRRPAARGTRPHVAWLLGALFVLTAGVAAVVDLADPPSPADRRASTAGQRQASRRSPTRPPTGPRRDERGIFGPQQATTTLEDGLDDVEPELRGAQRAEPALQLGWLSLGAEVIDPSLAPTGEDTGIIIVPRGPSVGDSDEKATAPEATPAVAPEDVERVEHQPAPERPRSRRSNPERPPAQPGTIDTGAVVTPGKAQDEQKK